MSHPLQGKHALVCGGSEGIGLATAQALAAMGADVTVLSRRASRLSEVAAALPCPAPGQRHGFVAADASDGEGLSAAVQALCAAQPVHILVNNTAGPPGGPAHAASPDDYVAVFGQHLVAGQRLVQAVLPGMKADGWGRIVNVISTSVKEPIANLGVSNTIRGAVASWAKTLASELGPFGITVNNVLPGYTRTQRLDQILTERAAATGQPADTIAKGMLATVPAGRFAEPAEIAAAIAFLASVPAGYVNGINLPVDGGRTRSL
ncbi:SDR family oxidoreductase [Arenimonas sp. MALMAid1274]|uniref:SDR family oxidoreductase n=1 Tax=Arenimonas sp. MALMAid1274 TaxID=3411630 RepID=UPI003B9E4248